MQQIALALDRMLANKSNGKPKALIVTRSNAVKLTVRLILGRTARCHAVRSAPDGKHLFKTTDNIGILVLDWSLQDKYSSIFKCLCAAKSKKNVLVINIFDSDSQMDGVFERLPALRNNNKIYFVSTDFMSISLSIALLEVRKRIS